MNIEIKNSLSALEQSVADLKKECRKNAFEIVNFLVGRYPECKDEILSEFKEICKRQDVDFYSEIRITGYDIVNYVENNVKITES